MIKVLCSLLAIFFSLVSSSQPSTQASAGVPWRANWIAVPDESPTGYGVYLFRKEIELTSKPSNFIVNVSADNRYKLYVNEKLVSLGPARGDLYYWNYETLDLAAYLQTGKNVIAALVWNEAEHRPEAQLTFQTGFILNGASIESEILNTNPSWKCIRQKSYEPIPVKVPAYYVAGAGERVDMNQHISGWEKVGFDDSSWKSAKNIGRGLLKGAFLFDYRWMLIPSPLPQMELKDERILKLRSANVPVPSSFPQTTTPIEIKANTKAQLILDQTYLTNAYFNLTWSRGKNAVINITYAESYSKDGIKGDRNEIEGKTIIGRKDQLISNGANNNSFNTLWWRTYRYIQLDIETQNEPLVIENMWGTATGYPFQQTSSLQASDPFIKPLLDIGWHTAKLCAVETYMDCPYYEQLQYTGDTRIQSLVNFYNTSDDRLVRNAINLTDWSRISEGLSLSRHPSFTPQIIPTFSLWYIHMLHDYWWYKPDAEFVKSKLQGTRDILEFFHRYQQTDGSLKNVPYWVFTDWVDFGEWKDGVAPFGKDGSSSVLDLQLLWAYQVASELELNLGDKQFGLLYLERASQLKTIIKSKYWAPDKNLFSDTSDKTQFSQHANILAILSGVADNNQSIATLILQEPMAPASIYFKYYLHRALIKAGMGNDYLTWLGKWRENMQLGLTTWAEMSDVPRSRSDCHAWGSHPNIEVFRTILGFESDSPAFNRVKIEPHIENFKDKISGSIPHPAGMISAIYTPDKKKWKIEIDLPKETDGTFIWKSSSIALHAGKNLFEVNK